MKTLRRRQAWLRIARAYDRYDRDGDLCIAGLCHAVMRLFWEDWISAYVARKMHAQINRYGDAHHFKDGLPFWEYDAEHAPVRAAVARELADSKP